MAELKIISMDEVQSKEVNWLWYPYIPYGKITIIQGDPGEGKTTLALRLAALLSKGEALPYDDTEREPVKIIYQTAEDGLEDTIKPRLESAEADCTQISGSNSIKFRRGAGCPFQRAAPAGELSADNGATPHNPLGERKTCLQVAFLIGLPVKSAFALLLTRVTEPRKYYLQEIGGVIYKKNDQRNGW